MQNFKFESYPEIDFQNLIKDFDHRIKTIEDAFKSDTTSIKIEKLLNTEKDVSVIDKLKIIGCKPKNLKEFQGAYIFYDPEVKKIVYVGISRKLIQRIRQHVNYNDPNTASLAYLMAKRKKADELGWKTGEQWKEKCPEWKKTKENFDTLRVKHQDTIKSFLVTFSEFKDSFEMALFEVYAAMYWKAYWNSFRTH